MQSSDSVPSPCDVGIHIWPKEGPHLPSGHLFPQAGEVKQVGILHFSRLREKVDRAKPETDEGLLKSNAIAHLNPRFTAKP